MRYRMYRKLVWLGSVTGVLLVLAIGIAIKHQADGRERRRQIDELTRAQQTHLQARDYAAAWTSLAQALAVAESGGMLARFTHQLDAEAQQVRTTQENVAMVWADELRVQSDEKYSPIVDKIAPVLARGAASATGTRKANLLAHLGWAMFFKSLDGASTDDPTKQYRAAIAVEAANPYAHAYLGHWIAWSGGSMDDAMKEFDAALINDSFRVFVRRIEREALRKRGQEAEPALIALVTGMRRNGEDIESSLRSDVDGVYMTACGGRENTDGMRKLLAFVPAGEQVVTYRRLFYDLAGRIRDPEREAPTDACLATLLESAGQREDALQVWRRVQREIGTSGGPLKPRADAAIQRLRTVKTY